VLRLSGWQLRRFLVDEKHASRKSEFLHCDGVEVALVALKRTIAASQKKQQQEQQEPSESARASLKHAESACGTFAAAEHRGDCNSRRTAAWHPIAAWLPSVLLACLPACLPDRPTDRPTDRLT
jgi:hypothetical protein